MRPVAALSHTVLEVPVVLLQLQLKFLHLPLKFNDIILILHNLVICVQLNLLLGHGHLFFQQFAMLQSVSLVFTIVV